jgi:hypothetical protein
MEAVTCGCRPVLPNRLAYPELHPNEYLYDSLEQATRMTLDSIGTTFDNSYAGAFLWSNVLSKWDALAHKAYDTHFSGVGLTEAARKMVVHLTDHVASKKEILRFMGWGQLTAWGKYRAMLAKAGVPITKGPNPTFGSGVTSQSLF